MGLLSQDHDTTQVDKLPPLSVSNEIGSNIALIIEAVDKKQ